MIVERQMADQLIRVDRRAMLQALGALPVEPLGDLTEHEVVNGAMTKPRPLAELEQQVMDRDRHRWARTFGPC